MEESGSALYFGQWLQLRRKALDMTRAELAVQAGCSIHAVRKIETGERRPSKQLAELLAEAVEIPPEEREIFVKVARGERSVGRLPPAGGRAHAVPVHSSGPGATAATPAPAPIIADNLPVYLTPFVGRASELLTLARLLEDPLCRLLTLVGVGGIGKTRLAIAAASQQRERFRDGICFVPLAPLGSAGFLVEAIADTLSFSFQSQGEPRTQLLDHLAEKQMLLVLDNFEHLLAGVDLLAEILRRAPGIKLLATSRERLNLQSEWVHTIEGLTVPPVDQAARAEAYTAVELFLRSAQRAQVGFTLRDRDRAAVVRICQLVEGIPLSIELAATWVSLLSCEEIAEEIGRSFDFLATSATDVPERQRSQRAVFNHSWKLLSDDERCVLSRLGLFQGGFEREAALEVIGATLPMLLTLASKSLVRRTEKGRFDLHEAVRQYALSHLHEDPAGEEARARHAHYYLSYLRERGAALHGPAQRDAIRELKAEIDNLRAAWDWAVAHEAFSALAPVLRILAWFCNVGTMYRVGVEQTELVIRALRDGSIGRERKRVLASALAQQGQLLFRQGKFELAMERFETSLSILRAVKELDLLADPLVLSGIILHMAGELERARSRFDEGLIIAQSAGDKFYEAYALFNLGYVSSLEGDYAGGYAQMLEGLALWRELGDPSSVALGLSYISPVALHLGYVPEAQVYLRESITLLTESGDRWGLGTSYRFLGLAAMAQGEYEQAQSHLYRSLEMFDGVTVGWDFARSLTYLGDAVCATGEVTKAQGIFCEALQLAVEHHSTPLVLDALAGLVDLKARSGEYDGAYWISLVVANHQATTAFTRERARTVLGEIEANLSPEQMRSAKARAANIPLEQVAALVLAG